MPSPAPLPRFLALVIVALLCAAPLSASTRRAFLFVGLSTNETQAARLLETAELVQTGLLRRGFDPASVLLHAPEAGRPLRRENILAALAPAPGASADDETWIVLLGSSALDRNGRPAFQITGRRLTATDLAQALAALPGRKCVVVATSASGGFLPPLLALPDTDAVAATAATGQVSEPRFASFWAETLAARPDASFAELAAAAAGRVAAFYAENSFAQSETARLLDRASGKILEAPFDTLAPGNTEPRPGPTTTTTPLAPPIDIARIEIPKAAGHTEVESLPADEKSLALLAEARSAARSTEHAALILRTEFELLVADDFSSRETRRTRAYLRTGEALDRFGVLHLPSAPPFVSSALVSARVIRPDGSQLLLNPAARSARLAAEAPSGNPEPRAGRVDPSVVELPEVIAGCLVETEWTTDRRTDGTLPEFYDEWHFAHPYPQRSLRVSLALPSDSSRWRAFAPHLPAPASSGATRVWELSDLPAHEPLPGDPPARSFLPWLAVSSVPSWDAFAAWYRRLAEGSDTTGPGVEALAAEIAAAHPDRASRLRAAYEKIAALRYVAIELGVGAFRPRTPEQVWRQRHGDCKDKANLLVAVLARLGIPAEFALVNRFDTTFTDFPGWQFNHALARVPADPAAGQPRDLWLDTTDRLVPFGVVAPGNLGRHALVFSPGLASASFHKITAAQEPPAEWRETFAPLPDTNAWRVELAATGSADLRLRHLLLHLGPEQRRARLADLFGRPVSAVETSDPYDLSSPCRVVVHADSLPPEPRPLLPGLRAFLAESPRQRLWDDGRSWTYTRVTPSGTETKTIPSRLP